MIDLNGPHFLIMFESLIWFVVGSLGPHITVQSLEYHYLLHIISSKVLAPVSDFILIYLQKQFEGFLC